LFLFLVTAQNSSDFLTTGDDFDNLTSQFNVSSAQNLSHGANDGNDVLKEPVGSVIIKKVWNDNNNADGKRPS
jgi:hypothetical protein